MRPRVLLFLFVWRSPLVPVELGSVGHGHDSNVGPSFGWSTAGCLAHQFHAHQPTPVPPQNPGKVAAPLLKQYQEEIDALTRRARHAEGAFLELYQELYEVGGEERGWLFGEVWGW